MGIYVGNMQSSWIWKRYRKKLIKEQGLPAYKPDNKIWKFKISEVDEWMMTKRIGKSAVTGDERDV